MCLNMWFFPWGILTRYENLNGEMVMNHGNGEGQPIFRRQPANGLSSCGLKSSYGKQTLQILGIPMFATEMICKWIFSKFVEKIHWHLELSCIYIYIYIQGSPSKALNVCFAFSTTHSGSKLWPLQLCSSGWMNPSAATSRTKRIAIW